MPKIGAPFSEATLRRLYLVDRYSYAQIGKQFNITDKGVQYWVKKWHIPARDYSESVRNRWTKSKGPDPSANEVADLYKRGMGAKEIAKRVGRSQHLVRRILTSENVPLRNRKDAASRRAPVRYWQGKKRSPETVAKMAQAHRGRVAWNKDTGNGTYWIGAMNPDFIWEEQRLCIEVGNHFHHPAPWAQVRIIRMRLQGWACMVFLTDRGITEPMKQEVRLEVKRRLRRK